MVSIETISPFRRAVHPQAGVTGPVGRASVGDVTQLKLDTFLPYRLSVVSNRVSAAIATAYDRLFALKIPEWRLIAVIAEGQPITQQAVGVATRMDKVTVSRAAQALVERGLIARQPNMGDKRSHLLALTAGDQASTIVFSPTTAPIDPMMKNGSMQKIAQGSPPISAVPVTTPSGSPVSRRVFSSLPA